ncbi:MAG TPA: hypothetical protein VFT64_10085 [Rickettsiales bacterium]|nr:hypothetical protein [Rickettsiales bacterium]
MNAISYTAIKKITMSENQFDALIGQLNRGNHGFAVSQAAIDGTILTDRNGTEALHTMKYQEKVIIHYLEGGAIARGIAQNEAIARRNGRTSPYQQPADASSPIARIIFWRIQKELQSL